MIEKVLLEKNKYWRKSFSLEIIGNDLILRNRVGISLSLFLQHVQMLKVRIEGFDWTGKQVGKQMSTCRF